jgi:hypothetical protein
MFMTVMALTGVLITYSRGHEIGREKWNDDGKALHSELEFAGQKSAITLHRSPRDAVVDKDGKTTTRELLPGTVALENGQWQAYALAAEQFPDAREPVAVKILLPSSGATIDGSLKVTAQPDKSRRVELSIGLLAIEVELAANGAVTHVAVPAQGIEVRPEGAAAPAVAKRGAPDGVVEEPIEIHRGETRVRGVLWRPNTEPTKKADRLPVALFIAGSGPTDRDGNSHIGLATDCYRLLAESLAKAGVATLRYDKRGIGASDVVKESDLTIDDYVNDAAALVAQLRADSRFSKVTVIGHSEGGLIGLLLAQKTRLDGLVLIAAPGRPLWQIVHEQLSHQYEGAKLAELDAITAALRDGQPVKAYPPETATLFRPSVEKLWRSELPLDPAALLGKLKLPVTIIQGETDVQVSVEDARRLAAAKKSAHLVLLPRVNHVLKEEATRSQPRASYTNDKRPLGPGVAEAVQKGVR